MLTLKQKASSILSATGIHALVEQARLLRSGFILTYHRILTTSELYRSFIQPGMFVSKSTFESHVCFLRNHYRVITLDALVERVKQRKQLGGYCAITFDDGWRDTFTNAYPILEKYSVPATIFLATGFVGTDRCFWPDEVATYLAIINRSTAPTLPVSLPQPGASSATPEEYLDFVIESLKGMTPVERDQILYQVRRALPARPATQVILNWDEARIMMKSGLLTFGAHTVNHQILDQLEVDQIEAEISQSRAQIEANIGGPVTSFAYPNGNHNEQIRKMLQQHGFITAVTTRRGLINRRVTQFDLPRIAIHQDISSTIPMLRSRILLPGF